MIRLCEHCCEKPVQEGRRYCSAACRLQGLAKWNRLHPTAGPKPKPREEKFLGLTLNLTPEQAIAAALRGGHTQRYAPQRNRRAIKRGVIHALAEMWEADYRGVRTANPDLVGRTEKQWRRVGMRKLAEVSASETPRKPELLRHVNIGVCLSPQESAVAASLGVGRSRPDKVRDGVLRLLDELWATGEGIDLYSEKIYLVRTAVSV